MSKSLLEVTRLGSYYEKPFVKLFFIDGKRVSAKEFKLVELEFPIHESFSTERDYKTGNIRQRKCVRKETV